MPIKRSSISLGKGFTGPVVERNHHRIHPPADSTAHCVPTIVSFSNYSVTYHASNRFSVLRQLFQDTRFSRWCSARSSSFSQSFRFLSTGKPRSISFDGQRTPERKTKRWNYFYRHFKLEAEIASMTWKVHWNDIIVMPNAKTRGSMYSLMANKMRGSQLVNTREISRLFRYQRRTTISSYLRCPRFYEKNRCPECCSEGTLSFHFLPLALTLKNNISF